MSSGLTGDVSADACELTEREIKFRALQGDAPRWHAWCEQVRTRWAAKRPAPVAIGSVKAPRK